MTIMLSPKVEEIINQKVNSGAYSSTDEVILTALQLLSIEEEKIENLRRRIDLGKQEIQQGKYTVLTTDSDINQLADEIIRECQIKAVEGKK